MDMERLEILLAEQADAVAGLFAGRGGMACVQADFEPRAVEFFDERERRGDGGDGQRRHGHVLEIDDDFVLASDFHKAAHEFAVHVQHLFFLLFGFA